MHQQHPIQAFSHWLTATLPQQFQTRWTTFGTIQSLLAIALLLAMSWQLIVTPLEIWQQGCTAIALILVGLCVVKAEQLQPKQSQVSDFLHLFLMWLSLITTLRYLYYRTQYTLNLDSWVNGAFSLMLYGAECYAIFTLLLTYFQTLQIKTRRPVDLSLIPQAAWPDVDIYIPTYNEEVEIVRKTIVAALAIDYPSAKKSVYVLDDGRAEKYRDRRQQLRQVCEELGCGFLTRDNNDHAKAGNINTALKRTGGELVLILDCDHIPTRSILQETVGFFRDGKVALVQTPHWFYNPDPFERNLMTQGRVPVGNELFYKVLQKGNDHWNAAFFCGSAAVIRRAQLLEVGGIATETVTEDCHTSLRLHSQGYKSVYYDKIMVAGLAPETFSSYVGQQVRWARGMAQILRLENPLFNRKLNLSLAQRICYFSATSHFFFGFPRLMYAIAPTLFLLFRLNPIRGIGIETVVYALPHIMLAMQANYIPYKNVRFSFWNELFEFALSFQAGLVTLMAVINPNLGSFNVTDKGLMVEKRQFDWRSVSHLLVIIGLIVASLAMGPVWLKLHPEEAESVLVNMAWCLFNLVLLIAASLVALEQPQQRKAHRLQHRLQANLWAQSTVRKGITQNISETGAAILVDHWSQMHEQVELEVFGESGASVRLMANVLRVELVNDVQSRVVVEYEPLSTGQADELTLILYSDVQEWYGQNRSAADNPLDSLKFVTLSLRRALRRYRPAPHIQFRQAIRTPVQLFWDGHFYQAWGTAIHRQGLRLEMEIDPHFQAKLALAKQSEQPALVGLIVDQFEGELPSRRLVGQILAVKPQASSRSEHGTSSKLLLEIGLPQALAQRQRPVMQSLLQKLPVSPGVTP